MCEKVLILVISLLNVASVLLYLIQRSRQNWSTLQVLGRAAVFYSLSVLFFYLLLFWQV